MLHALVLAARADRFVQKIVGTGGTECRNVSGAKTADRFQIERRFARGKKLDRIGAIRSKLGPGVESTDRIEGAAEEIETERIVRSRRPEVDDAAAESEIAGLAHRTGARIAVLDEKTCQRPVFEDLTRTGYKARAANGFARRNALQKRMDGCGHHRGRGVFAAFNERSKRRKPYAFDVGFRGKPIIGKAIPSREAQNVERRRKKTDGFKGSLRGYVIGCDEEHKPVPARGGFGGEIRIVSCRRTRDGETSFFACNVGQAFHVGCFPPQIIFSRANTGVS